MFIKYFAGLPDPFAKICVDGSGQVHTTTAVKATLDPKWNTHYDLYLTKGDGITIRFVIDRIGAFITLYYHLKFIIKLVQVNKLFFILRNPKSIWSNVLSL